MPCAQPCPRKEYCEASSIRGSGASSRTSSVSAITWLTDSPREARSSISVVVANTVCTTHSSSAKSSTMVSSLICATGVDASATMAVRRADEPASASTTSVVVPDLLIASTRSYFRVAGSSLAVKKSVSPRPAASRSTAYASAMNHDVPQPITATRSPALGSEALTAGSRSRARRQVAGCDSISVLTCDMGEPFWCGQLVERRLAGGAADAGGGQSAGQAGSAQALLGVEVAQERVEVRRVE